MKKTKEQKQEEYKAKQREKSKIEHKRYLSRQKKLARMKEHEARRIVEAKSQNAEIQE